MRITFAGRSVFDRLPPESDLAVAVVTCDWPASLFETGGVNGMGSFRVHP